MKQLGTIAFAWLILFPAVLFGDRVYLRNGQQLDGEILNQNRTDVQFRANGQTVTLHKADIKRLVYGSPAVADPAEEQRKREIRASADRLAAQRADEERRKAAEEEAAKKRELARKQQEEAGYKAETNRSNARRTEIGSTRGGGVWRSAVLPGWGDFYLDHPWIGAASAGLFAGSLLNSYHLRTVALASKTTYRRRVLFVEPLLTSSGNIPVLLFLDQRARAPYSRAVGRSNASLAVIPIVYLAQLGLTALLGGRAPASGAQSLEDPIPGIFNARVAMRFDFCF